MFRSKKGFSLAKLGSHKDMVMAVFLVAMIFMMILPLPTGLVDMLIGLNMSAAILLLIVSIYLKSPLELVAFPAILLITTLFRLSLSITTTRLILLQADAGQIIETFGNFVVGGNIIVGIVIFLIITIVQFIVITKGSERVAEVSARFSLDAMPGKQMSIDGDLRAGVIDVEEAKNRRELIQKESQLYGSMDGAMKFVKGDAIAGLIIIVVNLIGGISIGTLQNDMTAGEALQLYAILTIGDGLIAQIPALFIAITAGIIVTRVTTEESENLGTDIFRQVGSKPRAVVVSAALLLAFALIPGFPKLTFLVLALVFGGLGYYVFKLQRGHDKDAPLTAMAAAGQAPIARNLSEAEEFTLTVPLLIELASDIEDSFDTQELNGEILKIRRALYLDLGVPFPGIHLRFNHGLANGRYIIHLQETPIAEGVLHRGQLFIHGQQEQLKLLSVAPISENSHLANTRGQWVGAGHRSLLDRMAVPYLTPPKVLSFHLSLILKQYADEFIGIQESRYLLEKMEGRYSELVKEVQRLLPIQKITEIFQRLVSEDVSIRNLRSILEALVEWAQKEKETVLLTEYVRGSLKRYICYKYSNSQNILPAYLLDQEVEDTLRGGIRQTSAGAYLALDPDVNFKIVESIKKTVGDMKQLPHKPVIVVAMDIRRYLKKLLEQELNELPILSFQEITSDVSIQPLGRVVFEEALSNIA